MNIVMPKTHDGNSVPDKPGAGRRILWVLLGMFIFAPSFLPTGQGAMAPGISENGSGIKATPGDLDLSGQDSMQARNGDSVVLKAPLSLTSPREKLPFPPQRPLSLAGSGEVGLEDIRLYRKIFAYQTAGQWAKADEMISALSNPLLLSHVLHQRYMHPTAYRPSYMELKDWLGRYASHPSASDIYRLAVARKPEGETGSLPKPASGRLMEGTVAELLLPGKSYRAPWGEEAGGKSVKIAILSLRKDIHRNLRVGAPTKALSLLQARDHEIAARWQTKRCESNCGWMKSVERDRLLAAIAQSYYYAGKSDKALQLAVQAADRSETYVPLGAWISGLSFWQREQYGKAANYFEVAASSPYSDGWMISAASYWAARAHIRSDNFTQITPWLSRAAEYKRTFYGLLANRALGRTISFNWDIPAYTEKQARLLRRLEAGRRATALLDAGQVDRAEEELTRIQPRARDIELQRALLAVAQTYQMPSLSLRLGGLYRNGEGDLYDSALYPMMSWKPQTGFLVDRALIHAFIRQESKFDRNAQSHIGATGLMQLMLQTASYMDGERTFSAKDRYLLKDPVTNIELGQKYISYLLASRAVGSDIISLAMAYNAGPGNLARWKREMPASSDPLLFLETIPIAETRVFVERVLSNYWIYRLRLGQETPSLTMLAEDKWPIYMPQEDNSLTIASAGESGTY